MNRKILGFALVYVLSVCFWIAVMYPRDEAAQREFMAVKWFGLIW